MNRPIRFGFWLPIFGGWLRNVPDEGMEASWAYSRRLAQRAEQIGFDVTLVAELNLNDIKGADADTLESWTTAAALAAVTERLEIMAALRPGFRLPAISAKMAANIDRISGGRFTLNVVSAWWKDEMQQYGGEWVEHDRRYDRTREFIEVMRGMWTKGEFTHAGDFYTVEGAHLAPKPVQSQGPRLYAGGESDAAKQMIAELCDSYLMHGDPPENVAPKVAEMERRRREMGKPPMGYGMAGYAIVRDSDVEVEREIERITTLREDAAGFFGYKDFTTHSQLERELALRDYSVSNRGLRAGLTGTPEAVAERLVEFKKAGVDTFLLQFSPQMEEMERFAEEVIPRVREIEGGEAAA